MKRIMTITAMLFLLASNVMAQTITRVTMSGDTGDYISQGQTTVLTPDDGNIMLYHGPLIQNGINFRFLSSDLTQNWTFEFGGPDGTSPQVGRYDDAQRYEFAGAGHPRLSVYGNGRGCNQLNGTFTIKNVTYNADGAVLTLWLTFEQHCEGGVPALRGEIIFQMDASTPTRPTTWGSLKSIYR